MGSEILGNCAGNGTFLFSTTCWSCVDAGYGCDYLDENQKSNLRLTTPIYSGVTSNLTTQVTIPKPGGGLYRLAYKLTNSGEPPNSWQAVIGSPNGAFAPNVLESLTDSPTFSAVNKELFFTLPSATTVITVTFLSSNVSV
jgi:hypothetical protein